MNSKITNTTDTNNAYSSLSYRIGRYECKYNAILFSTTKFNPDNLENLTTQIPEIFGDYLEKCILTPSFLGIILKDRRKDFYTWELLFNEVFKDYSITLYNVPEVEKVNFCINVQNTNKKIYRRYLQNLEKTKEVNLPEIFIEGLLYIAKTKLIQVANFKELNFYV